jgi:hypothetical protein
MRGGTNQNHGSAYEVIIIFVLGFALNFPASWYLSASCFIREGDGICFHEAE